MCNKDESVKIAMELSKWEYGIKIENKDEEEKEFKYKMDDYDCRVDLRLPRELFVKEPA